MIYYPNFGVSHSHERLLETYQILLLEPYRSAWLGTAGLAPGRGSRDGEGTWKGLKRVIKGSWEAIFQVTDDFYL